MSTGHVVISGTGRAGTSFLVQLLTHLGLDTGFDPATVDLSEPARAGLELDVRHPHAPYIVKSPFLCDYAEELLSAGRVQIDHVIVAVRRFEAAAASRAYVHEQATGSRDGPTGIPGGLWGTTSADEQVGVLRFKFVQLIEALVRHDVPMTFVHYPRLLRDPDYLYGKLRFLVGDVTAEEFSAVFQRVVRPDWSHQFGPSDT